VWWDARRFSSREDTSETSNCLLNLNTAKALGITIVCSILAQANEVIRMSNCVGSSGLGLPATPSRSMALSVVTPHQQFRKRF
jgi:hypothetical protein